MQDDPMKYMLMPVYRVVKPDNKPLWAPDIEPGKMAIALFTEELFAERTIRDFCPEGKVIRLNDTLELNKFLQRCLMEGVSYVSIDYQQETKSPFQWISVAELLQAT